MMSNKTTGALRKGETFWKSIREKARKRENSWDNARFVLVDVPLDDKELKKILPLGMWPSQPPTATLFISNYPKVSFPIVPYHEAAMLIHVHTPVGTGIHCCWMIVDDETALILGRELLGYPKKMGVFEFDEKEGNIQASISRRAVKVITIEGKRGLSQDPKPPVFDIKTFNVGAMGQFFAVNPIWMFRPREVIHESYQADIKLTLNDSAFDPIARLVTGEPKNGRIVVMDIPGGSPYMVPVGVAGPGWFGRTFNMRFR
jgi:acetoacetate decarboxylase